jgi:Zn-dependent protease with chaperone function
MRILALIAGILLILFGGGCSALFFSTVVPEGNGGDFLGMWIVGGLLPLAAGILLVRWGMKRPAAGDETP